MRDGLTRGKFIVRHHRRGDLKDDEVFVLVPGRDPAAVAALRAYAAATPDGEVAAALAAWADELDPRPPQGPALPSVTVAVWVATLATEVAAGRMSITTALQRIAGHAARRAMTEQP